MNFKLTIGYLENIDFSDFLASHTYKIMSG